MAKTRALTEEEFIDGIRDNNDAVMNQLYKLYYPMIQSMVVNNSGTDIEAKDIYQEAFIILYESLHDINFQLNCKIKTYLYSVCRRLWLKRLSYKGKFITDFTDNEGVRPVPIDEDTAEENELRFTLMSESMDKLGEPCKTIIEDYYIHGLSMQQITDKMGYTNPDNAKNQKYKCLNRLKKIADTLLRKADSYETGKSQL